MGVAVLAGDTPPADAGRPLPFLLLPALPPSTPGNGGTGGASVVATLLLFRLTTPLLVLGLVSREGVLRIVPKKVRVDEEAEGVGGAEGEGVDVDNDEGGSGVMESLEGEVVEGRDEERFSAGSCFLGFAWCCCWFGCSGVEVVEGMGGTGSPGG